VPEAPKSQPQKENPKNSSQLSSDSNDRVSTPLKSKIESITIIDTQIAEEPTTLTPTESPMILPSIQDNDNNNNADINNNANNYVFKLNNNSILQYADNDDRPYQSKLIKYVKNDDNKSPFTIDNTINNGNIPDRPSIDQTASPIKLQTSNLSLHSSPNSYNANNNYVEQDEDTIKQILKKEINELQSDIEHQRQLDVKIEKERALEEAKK